MVCIKNKVVSHWSTKWQVLPGDSVSNTVPLARRCSSSVPPSVTVAKEQGLSSGQHCFDRQDLVALD